MEPSNTSPPRTPPPSHITNSFSPGSKSMFPGLNIINNEKARPPQQKKRKVNKNNNNKTNNILPPNRVLTEEKQEERIKCLDILSDIQYFQNSNYECCVDICKTSNIKNIEIVTTYLNELKKHNENLCNIENIQLKEKLGVPPTLPELPSQAAQEAPAPAPAQAPAPVPEPAPAQEPDTNIEPYTAAQIFNMANGGGIILKSFKKTKKIKYNKYKNTLTNNNKNFNKSNKSKKKN